MRIAKLEFYVDRLSGESTLPLICGRARATVI
jgi:hypothetical protein